MQNSLSLAAGQPVTMSSVDLVDYINNQRLPGQSELRHDHFMEKVPKVLGEVYAPKFSGTQSYGNNNLRAVYHFPKREACLMAMSYSYDLQAKVFDRMTELEGSVIPKTMAQALRLAADQAEQLEQQQAALALAAPKVDFFDKVVDRSTLMTATQVAQKIGMSAISLNKHLDALDVYSKCVKRSRVFKQWVIDKGYGELKQTELGYSQPLFTTAGEAWIVERLTSEGVI